MTPQENRIFYSVLALLFGAVMLIGYFVLVYWDVPL